MFVGLVDAGEPSLLLKNDLFICASTLEEAKSLCEDNNDRTWIIYELIPGHSGYQNRWEPHLLCIWRATW